MQRPLPSPNRSRANLEMMSLRMLKPGAMKWSLDEQSNAVILLLFQFSAHDTKCDQQNLCLNHHD